MLRGNKGDWAEIYTFFQLMSDGRIYAANEKLEKLTETYFPIIKIIREEVEGKKYEYKTGEKIKIYFNDEEILEKDRKDFEKQAKLILEKIKTSSDTTFCMENTAKYMESIKINKLKASAAEKADITMQMKDINTGFITKAGFSIKSDFKSKPTLLNSSRATNFVYKIENCSDELMNKCNLITTRNKLVDRMNFLKEAKCNFIYDYMDNRVFENNLKIIDYILPKIIAEALKNYYLGEYSNLSDAVKYLEREDIINCNIENFYIYKIKKFLAAIALGMMPSKLWNGIDEANGGYVIVKSDGEILAYHIYNRNAFEEYLLSRTKFEKGSSTRHEYGIVYKENNIYYMKLNLAVRFL